MLKVSDIMTEQVFMLHMDTLVEEARWAFAKRHIGGAPVVDDEGRIAGFISKTDIVDPAWADWLDPRDATVGDVMQPEVLALSADAPAMNAVEGMAARGVHHVMVVNGDRFLVGIVTSLDVVKHLAKGTQFSEPVQPVQQPTA